MRASTGIAVTAVGAILLLAVNLPLPYLSLKIVGLILLCAGLAGLEVPRRVSGWVRANRRLMDVLDPGAGDADEPRVPLENLLDDTLLDDPGIPD